MQDTVVCISDTWEVWLSPVSPISHEELPADLIGTSCKEMEDNLNEKLPPYLKLLEPSVNHSAWNSDLMFSQQDFEVCHPPTFARI